MTESKARRRQRKVGRSNDPLFSSDKKLPVFDQEKLLEHFKVSGEVRDIFFNPGETLSPDRPRNKFRNKKFVGCWFKNVTIKGMNFQDCVFEDCRFIGTTIQDCEFHDCEFQHCNTHKIHFERTYIDPNSFTSLPSKVDYANIGVHLFQQLYRNSDEMLQPDFKNSAEYKFKRWQRFELAAKWRDGEPHKWRIAKRWTGNMFFYLLSGYGFKPFWVAGWFLVVLGAVIAFNYHYWPSFDFTSSSGLDVQHRTLALAVYYSTVTLSTLGYGDITPRSNFGFIIASFEVVVGLVGLAMLASVLIKKVLR